MNFLLVVVDDSDRYLLEETAIAQRFMVEGTIYPNYIISTPVCAPSRVTMFTGLYARNHGAQDNDHAFARSKEIDHTFIPTRLPGVFCGLIGKYINRYKEPYVPPGWDRWFGKSTLGMFNWEAFNGANLRTFGNDAADYATDVLCDLAESFIQNHDDPWFLVLSLNAPHGPYDVAPRHRDAPTRDAPRVPSFNEADVSDKPTHLQFPLLTNGQIADIDTAHRKRTRMMVTVSERLDTILDMVPADTIVALCADNGYTLGVHRRPTGKGVAWEESTNVPLCVRGPGFAPGAVDPRLVANIDIGPWVNQVMGGEPWANRDGNALLGHDHVLIQSTSTLDVRFSGVRTPSQVYVEYVDGGREFYDLVDDVYQLDNAYHTADPATIAHMQALLAGV